MRKLCAALFVFLLIVTPVALQEVGVWCSKVNLYKASFGEPYEILLLQSRDGWLFYFTNQLADRVGLHLDDLRAELKSEGLEIKDIESIVHNHWANRYFSEDDIELYLRLKEVGFTGRFSIYVVSTGKTYHL